MSVDVVYLTCNRREFTRWSFAALAANTDWSLVRRLVVYDDGSEDGTRELVEELLAGLVERVPVTTVLRAERDLGPVAIMQRHVADPASGPLFAKIDNDVCVPPGWLPAALSVMAASPEVELLGMEAGKTCRPGQWEPWDGVYRWRPTPHVGGVGVFRTAAFARRPGMRPDGRNGFTEWQHTHEPVCGWIDPDLPVTLLDRVPVEPWLSLSEAYEQRGWQRPWRKWDPATMSWAWDWLTVAEVAA